MRTLLVGMAAAITGSTVVAIAPDQTTFRSVMVKIGLLLMTAGYLLVAHRISGWRRGVLRIVAGLQLGWLVWSITRPGIVEALGDAWFDDIGYRLIAATLWWSGIVLLTIAARAWWRPATPWIVVAAVVAVVLEALPWAFGVDDYRPVREALTSVAILVLVRGILRSCTGAKLPIEV